MTTAKPLSLPALPSEPLVSVLIANYNYAAWVGKAIESVLSQTYQRFEIIVCDDGSTDNSLEIIRRYTDQDKRIKLIEKQNGGQASALNAAFAASRGDLIALLDADDEWYPTRIEKTIPAFRKPDIGLVTHFLKVVSSSGKLIRPKTPPQLEGGWLLPKILKNKTLHLCAGSSISLRREVAQLVFPLPENLRSDADGLIVYRAAIISLVESVEEVLGLYRQHTSNVTGFLAPLTLEGLDRRIASYRQLVIEKLRSLEHFGYQPEPEVLQNWEESQIGPLLRYRALMNGDTVSFHKLRYFYGLKQALFWKILFSMPRPIAIRLYQYWLKEPFIKRFLLSLIRGTAFRR